MTEEGECRKRHNSIGKRLSHRPQEPKCMSVKVSVKRGKRKRLSQEENLQKKDTVTWITQVDKRGFLMRQNKRR